MQFFGNCISNCTQYHLSPFISNPKSFKFLSIGNSEIPKKMTKVENMKTILGNLAIFCYLPTFNSLLRVIPQVLLFSKNFLYQAFVLSTLRALEFKWTSITIHFGLLDRKIAIKEFQWRKKLLTNGCCDLICFRLRLLPWLQQLVKKARPMRLDA